MQKQQNSFHGNYNSRYIRALALAALMCGCAQCVESFVGGGIWIDALLARSTLMPFKVTAFSSDAYLVMEL